MNIVFPIKLEQAIFRVDDLSTPIMSIERTDDFDFAGLGGVDVPVSGYDSSDENEGRGIRLTNLRGIHDGQLFKSCPNCESVKSMSDFGAAGRVTGEERRDQSNCNECRSRYK